MTEHDWLTATNPAALLAYLEGKVSARKLRLFVAACVQQVWHLLGDERGRAAVQAAQRHADRLITEAVRVATVALAVAQASDAAATAWDSAMATARATAWDSAWIIAVAQARAAQVCLLREIMCHHPLRPFTALVAGTRPGAWAVVQAIARVIYNEGSFGDLPVLADALEDAGCDNQEVLAHLRLADAVHVRGCWALDLVLGKE